MAHCMDINNSNNKKIKANSLSKYINAYIRFGVARDKCAPAVRRSRSIPAIFPRFKVIAMARKCRKHNVRDENTFLQIHHQNAKVPSWTCFFRRAWQTIRCVSATYRNGVWSAWRNNQVLSSLLAYFDVVLLPKRTRREILFKLNIDFKWSVFIFPSLYAKQFLFSECLWFHSCYHI